MKYPGVFLLGAVYLLSAASPASADVEEFTSRLKNCRDITSMLTRVQCYDQALDEYDLKKLDQIAVGDTPGKWKVTFEQSPINDGQNVYLSLSGNDYVTNGAGKFVRPSIVLRCMEGKAEGYTVWDSDLGTQDAIVNTRMGSEPVLAEKWKLSADMQGAFIPDPEKFALKILNQKTVFIKIWPQYNNPLQATFDVRGFSKAIQPLAQACKWAGVPLSPETAATPVPAAAQIQTPPPAAAASAPAQ